MAMSDAPSMDVVGGKKVYEPDGKVLAQFLECRKPVSVIRGPIGSGSSSACCMKIFMLACEQNEFEGKKRSRWIVVRNCYDADTEILTELRGWVLFKDLVPGEKVAQLKDGKLEFVEPTYYYRAPYVGEMVGFEGEGVDFRVTPDHNMWVSERTTRKKVWQPYELKKAKDCFGKQTVRVKRDAEWDGDAQGRSVDFYEWLGFWFAEGSATISNSGGCVRHQCVITQVKPGGIEYASELFGRACLPFSVSARPDGGSTFRLRTTPETIGLIKDLHSCGKAVDKRLPHWVKNAPPEHLQAFLKGFIAGDGHIGASTVAFTSSKQLADDLQEIALKAGLVANINSRDRRGVAMAINGVGFTPTSIEYNVTILQPSKNEPILRRDADKPSRYRGWYRETYSGEVFCVEVPTHVVYVRRNGKAMWCSQTYPELRDTTIKTWLEWFPESSYGTFFWSRPMRHEMRVGNVELDVYFLALDNPDDVATLRSREITGAWMNELEFQKKQLFDELQSRCRWPRAAEGGSAWYGVIADMNAPPEDHWIVQMTGEAPWPDDLPEDRRTPWPEQWGYYVQPSALIEEFAPDGKSVVGYRLNKNAENLKWLPKGYYENMVAGKTRQFILSRLMNRVTFVSNGDPVWPMFNPDQHISPGRLIPNPSYKVIVGLDFGRRPAAVFMQEINGRIFIQNELRAYGVGAATFAPAVKRFLALNYPGFEVELWGDPKGQDKGQADERTAYEIFATFGLMVRPAPVKNNHIQTRLEVVEHVLNEMVNGLPRYVLSPIGAPTLRAAMQGKYQMDKTDKGDPTPLKDKFSDIADAQGYAFLGMGEGRAMVGRSTHGIGRISTQHKAKSMRRIA